MLGFFSPPAIIASTVGVGLVGILGPNESGIIVLTNAADIAAVQAAMPQATKVRTAGVDDATAKSITDAAKQASLPLKESMRARSRPLRLGPGSFRFQVKCPSTAKRVGISNE